MARRIVLLAAVLSVAPIVLAQAQFAPFNLWRQGVSAGSQNYAIAGTYSFTVPYYNTLNVTATKGGTGGDGTNINAVDCGGEGSCWQCYPAGGATGSAGGNSSFATSTPVTNSSKAFTVGSDGAPLPGASITVTVGAGGAGGVGTSNMPIYCPPTTGTTGSAGSVNLSWN